MAPPPTFYFDFGSPNAYLAHKVLPEIEMRTGVKFVHQLMLLGGVIKATGNQSPMIAFAGVPLKLAYEGKETERFIRRHGIKGFTRNPHFPVNTLQIMRGAVAAEAFGVFMPYVEAVYRAMWTQGRKMDDPAVILPTLEEAGLPAEQLMTLTADDAVKARLIANTNDAVAHGVFGSPSFLVGEELFFGKDRLREVEEQILALRVR